MSGAAAVKVLDVPMQSSPAAPPRARRAARWDGTESPWVEAAWAAAPWPLWSLVVALGVPGGSHAPPWLHGGLALAVIFGAMVAWVHRPPGRILGARWIPTVLGTGLLAELLANALTDMGRDAGLAGLAPFGRALAVWLICAGIYEVAPMLAAASRVSAREHRVPALDAVAHLLFLSAALAVYAWAPSSRGWYVSPWTAALFALPLAVVRCGARRDAELPRALERRGALVGLAVVAWGIVALVFARDLDALHQGVHATWRRGADPLEGALWALPALSLLLSLGAAAHLMWLAARARRGASGTVTALGEDGLTIELTGEGEPTWVAIESGPMPLDGAHVTLLGLRERPADVGPFRDGAPRLSARRAWTGPPAQLARGLTQRAAGWLCWGAAGALGLWLRLL